MSLTSRLTALAQAIAADIKSLTTGLGNALTKAGGALTGPLELAAPPSMPSGATVNIGATASNVILLGTGTGDPVSSLGPGTAGMLRHLIFTDGVNFTHDITKLILPEGIDQGSNGGGSATFLCIAANVWLCMNWQYGPCATTHGPAYQQLQDYTDPTLSRMTLYGGALAYNQPPALIYGIGATLTYLQARTPTTPRRVWLPDADGDLFISPAGSESPVPPLQMAPKVGRYYAGAYNALAGGAVVSGDVYFNMVTLRQAMALPKVGFTVTTAGASGSTASITMYRVYNNTLVQAISVAQVATDSTGDKNTGAATQQPGTYLIAVRFNGACSINFQTATGPGGSAPELTKQHGAASSTETGAATTQMFITGTLPASGSALSAIGYRAGSNPHFWYQA